MINKQLFSHYPIDYYGVIWDKLIPLEFTKQTPLPKDILCFLESGMVRKCMLEDEVNNLNELSLEFYFAGDIFTAKADNDIEAQFTYQPLSKGKLWYVDMEVVRTLFSESLLCSATQKVFMEERLRDKTMREIHLLRKSPAELYTYLLKNKPRYIQSVPLKYLASYVGVTPQALSRIRKRVS